MQSPTLTPTVHLTTIKTQHHRPWVLQCSPDVQSQVNANLTLAECSVTDGCWGRCRASLMKVNNMKHRVWRSDSRTPVVQHGLPSRMVWSHHSSVIFILKFSLSLSLSLSLWAADQTACLLHGCLSVCLAGCLPACLPRSFIYYSFANKRFHNIFFLLYDERRQCVWQWVRHRSRIDP